ncbi:phosphopantetheine-binding protein [Paenibacillus sp. GCM10027627]|uniref:phosphopantetheine-binding protein n=1 Tax=unclassified Paenibacillus TaxID=185978 RepID=UPI00363B72C7
MTVITEFEVESKMKEIIKNVSPKPIEIDDIKEGTEFIKDFGFDSYQFIQLVAILEVEFEIEFEQEELICDILLNYDNLKQCLLGKLNPDRHE